MSEFLDYKGLELVLENLELKEHEKIFMKDKDTDHEYVVKIQDGKIFAFCIHEYGSIEVINPPDKIEYTAGEIFDPTGMVVLLIDKNGDTEKVTGYTCDKYVINDTINITYKINDKTYSTSINVIANPIDPDILLKDFEYIANEDGTYTITAWKETFNGEPSTECIIPDNALINV